MKKNCHNKYKLSRQISQNVALKNIEIIEKWNFDRTILILTITIQAYILFLWIYKINTTG